MKNYHAILFNFLMLFLIFSTTKMQAQYTLTSIDVDFDIASGTITNYHNLDEKDIIIPDNFEGVTVTAIDDGVFIAFNLTSVVFPATLTYIGEEAFLENSLSTVIIPPLVTSISREAFRENNLTSITIHSSVTSIGEGAFMHNSLTEVEIPNSVISIDAYAFARNSIDTLNIPSSVTSIGIGVFYENNLESISLPTSIAAIPDNAFAYNLLSDVYLHDSITSIGAGAFENNSLTSFSVPLLTTSIGDNAFNNNSLSGILFSSSLTGIGAGAFNNNLLPSVTLPLSITSIGTNAFNNNLLGRIVLPLSINGYGARWKDSDDADVLSIEDFSKAYSATVIGSPFLYTITYINNGGLHSNTTDIYTIENADISLTNATKNGYTFQGWYENENYTGSAISVIDSGSVGNLILYAKFRINSYIVTFEDYDGTELKIDTVNFGNTASAPIINPVREGYIFTGWDADFDFITSILTVSAQYSVLENAIIKVDNRSDIRIYPIPAKNQIVIEGVTDRTISIYNDAGVKVKEIPTTSNKQVVDIDDLTSGLYFVKTDSFTQQIVVSR